MEKQTHDFTKRLSSKPEMTWFSALSAGFAYAVILFFPFFLFFSCASIGNPLGGDYDITPPNLLKSAPEINATNYNRNKIALLFDEYISIEKPSEKVIITPPQKSMPVIRAIGKKIMVELKDTLLENTTYTFDFTNSIVDNNEKNAIEGFAFAFSTGDILDTLMISGTLLNAENLEPMPNIMVGLHANLEDTAFTSLPFLRTSMTNDRGQFKIRNIAPGTYRIYALKDINKNYFFDPPAEEIAFFDSLIAPSFEPAVRWDTIWVDSLTIDTIKEVHYTRFIPDDIVMHLFQQKFDNQFLLKTERPSARQIILRFNSEKGLPPEISLLEEGGQDRTDGDWYIRELSSDLKSVTYWINDTLIYKRDTLWIKAVSMASDSVYNLVPKTDTIRFVWKSKETAKEAAKKKKKKEEEKPKTEFLDINITAKTGMDVFDTVKIVFAEPVKDFDAKKIRIQQKVDTLWENREFPIAGDTLNPRAFYVDRFWDYEEEFRIIVDSAAIFSIYDKWNDSINRPFKFKKEEEYANFIIRTEGAEGSGFGELMDKSDKVVRKSFLEDGVLYFENISPGSYYVRYIEDTNGNGMWDAGDYSEHRQAEKVYYNTKKFDFRKFQTLEQTWNLNEFPSEKQKPLEITKNKPEQRKTRTDRQPGKTGQQNSNANRTNVSNDNRTLQNRF